ncbi:MAG: GNAT family N-acetyltransferase [Actinomycetota bacterium]
MYSIVTARSDADLERWRQVRLAVAPGERAATVAELREAEHPGRLLVLAERDGQLVGSGIADDSDLPGGFLCPRVLPGARRRGAGAAILAALARHNAEHGHAKTAAVVEDEGSLAFAHRFGFAEVDREVEQIRKIGAESAPVIPPGIEIVSVADRPELWEQAYHRVYETFADLALTAALQVSLADWNRDYIKTPEATFMALADGQVVGVASLRLDDDQPSRGETGYTAVRREWRGRGIASALKRTTLAWGAAHGMTEVYTWTQRGNDDMRAVNERLGYTYGAVSIRVEAPLPLP